MNTGREESLPVFFILLNNIPVKIKDKLKKRYI